MRDAINLGASYFALPNPLERYDRWRNPYCHQASVDLHGKSLDLSWTTRAERELLARDAPLLIELQLYFSCVVKKRVLFDPLPEIDGVRVNDRLYVGFSAVSSAACDPREFAANYPADRDLGTGASDGAV